MEDDVWSEVTTSTKRELCSCAERTTTSLDEEEDEDGGDDEDDVKTSCKLCANWYRLTKKDT